MSLPLFLDPASLVQSFGYAGIFVLMALESACIPIPSEAVMPLGGFFASEGTLQLWAVILSGTLGNVAGSLIAYGIGYALEESVLVAWIRKYGHFILVSESDYIAAAKRFDTYGSGITFFSRLLPAVRTFISLPAGMFEMDLKTFLVYTSLGSLAWSSLLTGIGFYLGNQWETIGPIFSKLQYAVIACLMACVVYYVYHKLHKHQ